MIKLDILSDPICPWCYIGKTQLFRALDERPDHPFTIEWHPFRLDPDMPPGGADRRAYLEARFGGRKQLEQADARVAQAAEAAGAPLDLAAIRRVPDTLDAHRLIHWAGIEGRQTDIVHRLFEANFAHGRDIGDRDVLADLADSAGMDAAAIRRLLASDADSAEIRARAANARERGVTGVPTFIIGNQHVVPGAQPPELWIRLIDEIAEQVG